MNDFIQEKQKRKPTEVRKREIIDVAINIIAFDGARAFTAKNIADAIGMTSGGIFRHYESMESIVEGVIKRVEEVLACDFPSGVDDPIKRLEVFFLQRTRTILTHPDISLLLLSDHLEQAAGVDAAKRLAKVKKLSKKFVHECLSDAKQTGILDAGVDIDAATIIVIGAILSMSHVNTRFENKAKKLEVAREVWGLLVKILKTSKPHDDNNIDSLGGREQYSPRPT